MKDVVLRHHLLINEDEKEDEVEDEMKIQSKKRNNGYFSSGFGGLISNGAVRVSNSGCERERERVRDNGRGRGKTVESFLK